MDTPDFARYLNTPLPIGSKTIFGRLVLAPMAGLGHIAFRQLVAEFGGFGLLFTGMCSARAVPHENPVISPVFRWRRQELPYTVCQIFGAAPDTMAKAARRIEQEGFFGVDLNFGCSVAAICKKGCGAALLKTPDKAAEIVSAVRKAVSFPVFVKFRTGWSDDAAFAADMANRFEAAGADALVFHPRVAPDRRTRPPNWDIITQVTNAVTIPVFGNGNLFAVQDGMQMTAQTGCQGLALGRMAVVRPWIFAQWTLVRHFDNTIYLAAAQRLVSLLKQHYDMPFNLKLFKKFAPYFCANFTFSHFLWKQLNQAVTMEALEDTLYRLFDPCPQVLSSPNRNLLL
ncbi:MAG TPA: tRNA-dihydrouridine synthase family protein [Desulfotignum sp.]|nr:tRNA-dihydrouridine synthase family protein [Desulfotignum sp.]